MKRSIAGEKCQVLKKCGLSRFKKNILVFHTYFSTAVYAGTHDITHGGKVFVMQRNDLNRIQNLALYSPTFSINFCLILRHFVKVESNMTSD